MRLRVLLLDLDGTIADSHHLIYRSLDYAFQTLLGRHYPVSLWERSVGEPLHRLFEEGCAAQSLPPLTTLQIESLIQSYRSHLMAIDQTVQPFPGIPETLETLRRRGVRLAIVTTKHSTAAHRSLRYMGLASLFETVIASDQCTRLKPHPEPFHRALRALEAESAEAAGVGDSPHDIEAARAAGALPVAALWGVKHRAPLLERNPDILLEYPSDLIRLLDDTASGE
jgi:pyrophosphatase PpaX